MTFTLPILSFTRPLFPVLAHTLGLANSQRREFNHRRGMWPAFPADALGSMSVDGALASGGTRQRAEISPGGMLCVAPILT